MAKECPELENYVTIGNRDLVMKHILPLPPKLYEQVIAAVAGNGDDWDHKTSVRFVCIWVLGLEHEYVSLIMRK